MTTKNISITPANEPTIFTEELGTPALVGSQTEEEFFLNVRQNVKSRATGERNSSITTVSFESLGALLAVVTPQRIRIVEALKEKGHFESIATLADALQRDRGTVSKDVKALSDAGFLRVQVKTFPGHGRRSEIFPIAQTVRLELNI
jgi:predicted transcriptional regulator